MATLNGVTFGILKKSTTVIHDNIVIDIPGSDTVVQEDMGYSTAPMQIIGHVKNESEYDDFKEQFYSGGELTLIIDVDSGKQYTVFAMRNLTDLDGQMVFPLTDIVFQADFYMKNPYKESVLLSVRSKTITTNNQEWSADDSAADIVTGGNVDAVPDIKVTGGTGGYVALEIEPVGEPGFETVAGWIYSEVDASAQIIGGRHSGGYTGAYDYLFRIDPSAIDGEYGQIARDVDFTNIDQLIFRYMLYNGPNPIKCIIDTTEVWTTTTQTGLTWTLATIDTKAYTGTHSLKFKFEALTSETTSSHAEFDDIISKRIEPIQDIQVYNIADSTIKSNVANTILDTAIHRINVDGTGTIDFDDDFTTAKYLWTSEFLDGVTYDDANDKIDIADDGYIYYQKDTKYPITVIPTLTALINITAGTPTIQISTDAATWYDIDTAIVDDIDTVYALDNATNLSLAGKTVFYWRIDCVKAAAATCAVKSFALAINIHTIYAKNPKVAKDGANTFRCDQAADSGLSCEVSLYYRDRWWS